MGMCGHRGGLMPLDRLDVSRGDMRLLDRRFKCASCGSTFVALFLFAKRGEADSWATDPIGSKRLSGPPLRAPAVGHEGRVGSDFVGASARKLSRPPP
jgi:hypothetical protein